MKNFMVLIGLISFHLIAQSQSAPQKKHKTDYRTYYKAIIKAEKQYVNRQPANAFKTYDAIFKDSAHFTPFIYDVYNAAQFAFVKGDTVHFVKYITLAAKNGLTVVHFFKSPIFRPIICRTKDDSLMQILNAIFKNANYSPIPFDKKVIKAYYEQQYNQDSLYFAIQQKGDRPERAFAETENQFRIFLLNNFLVKGVFPSEKLLGLLPDSKQKLFQWDDDRPLVIPGNIWDVDTNVSKGLSLYNNRFALYLHNSCSFEKYGSYIWQAVLMGWLPPMQYALLEEACVFKSYGASVVELNVDSCQYPIEKSYFNILDMSWYPQEMQGYLKTKAGQNSVDSNRKSRFIRSLDTQKKMQDLQTEKKLKLFHGFMNGW